MVNKNLISSLFLQIVFFAGSSQTAIANNSKFQNPFYFGAMGGYGATTWQGLVPNKENLNQAISLSTPINVKEGGGVWGVFIGHEFSPFFALESNYMRYPDAKVFFEPDSLFSFDHNDLTEFKTKTESVALMAKLMIAMPIADMRAYSSLGVAGVHREDILVNHWRLTPTFGAGFNYQLSNHFMAELGGNYVAGYGESQLSPAEGYFPFLYSVSLRLAYSF